MACFPKENLIYYVKILKTEAGIFTGCQKPGLQTTLSTSTHHISNREDCTDGWYILKERMLIYQIQNTIRETFCYSWVKGKETVN